MNIIGEYILDIKNNKSTSVVLKQQSTGDSRNTTVRLDRSTTLIVWRFIRLFHNFFNDLFAMTCDSFSLHF